MKARRKASRVPIIVNKVAVKYDNNTIIKNLSINIPEGKITSIIGPNGCGKSTLLKAISTIIPHDGTISLGCTNVENYSRKNLSKMLAFLPQKPSVTNGISVEELVSYGRHPYASRFGTLSKEDFEQIHKAMEYTGVEEFKDRNIEELSGGQRQRVWIALCLAQDTDIIFLDEPTTYLDISHQLEVLELLKDLNATSKRTIVMVLHDLNQASEYSDNIIGLKNGELVASGTSKEVITKENIRELYNINADIEIINEKPYCKRFELVKEN